MDLKLFCLFGIYRPVGSALSNTLIPQDRIIGGTTIKIMDTIATIFIRDTGEGQSILILHSIEYNGTIKFKIKRD